MCSRLILRIAVPRFFFHVHDGVSLPDHVGIDLRDIAEAKRKAVEISGRLLSGEPELFWNGEEWSLDVCDATDLILFTLHFLATMAPASRQASPLGR